MTALARLRPRRPIHPAPPGPPNHPLLGVLPRFARDPLRFFTEVTREYGDLVRYRFLTVEATLLNHPDYVRHVLQENQRNYRHNEFGNEVLKLFLGDSLLTLDGSDWLRQRRLMAPLFHRQRIAGFGQTMSDAAEARVAQWQGAIARGEPLDIAEEMMQLTLRIVGLTLFSVDLSEEADSLGAAMMEAQHFFNRRVRRPLTPPLWFPTADNRRFNRARATVDATVHAMIQARRESDEQPNDLLTMLMEARDAESGEGMSDRQLRDETVTMLAAGHETTSNLLAWCFLLLAEHPEEEARLHEELARVLGGRTPTTDDLPSLPFTRRVLDETLRLYPPAWFLTRQANGPDEIGGYPIPPDHPLHFSPYLMHRHPAFWEEPARFDPDRFLPERSAGRPKFAYFPFGGGPHLCIGNAFALTEAQLLLATIAQRVRWRLVPGHPIEREPLVTLRPKHGIRMRLSPR